MICPNCGNDARDNSLFCTRCGAKFAQAPTQQNTVTDNAQMSNTQAFSAQMGRTQSFAAQQAQMSNTQSFAAQQAQMNRTQSFAAQQAQMSRTQSFAAQQGQMSRTQSFAPQPNGRKRPPARKKQSAILPMLRKFFSNRKNVIITAAAAAALIIISVILLVILGSGSEKYVSLETSIRSVYDAETNDTYFVIDGKKAAFTVDGKCVRFTTSFDGSLLCGEFPGGIYTVTAKKATCVADDGYDPVLSDNGKYIMYRDKNGNLCLYTVASGESVVISAENMFSYMFSPDGKVIIYSYYDDDDRFVLCKYSGGKSTHVGDGVMPVSVSNDGKYVYAYNTDGILYCYCNDQRVKISADVMPYFFINSDGRELGFFTDSSKAYVSVCGGDKIKMFTSSVENNGYIYPVTDAHSDATWRTVTSGYTTCIRTGMRSFSDSYISQAGCIYYVDENYNGMLYVPSYGQRNALIYENTIVYLTEDNELCTMPLNDSGTVKVIAPDAKQYVSTSDGKYVYFINDDDELWVNNGKKTQKLADDVDRMFVTSKDVILFLQDYSSGYGGTLCYSEAGRTPHRVAEDVSNVITGPKNTLYYSINDETGKIEIHTSANGKKFTFVTEVSE